MIPVYLIQATLLFVLLLLVLGLTSLYYIAPEPHPEVDEDEVEFIEKVKDWFDKEQVGQENESDNNKYSRKTIRDENFSLIGPRETAHHWLVKPASYSQSDSVWSRSDVK